MTKVVSGIINLFLYPSHVGKILNDLFRIKEKARNDEIHLKETMAWLKASQDHSGDGGCSGIYTFAKRWTSAYPETTGYIIPTFLNYSNLSEDNEYSERAVRMGNWEIEIQLKNGAVRGGVGVNQYPVVFNTGQVILGWTSLYTFTGEKKYLEAAKKAGDWLVQIQDSDGKWSKYTFNGIPHTYNVRVAWALLKLFDITQDSRYYISADKNIQWVLSNTTDNGWFHGMGFKIEEEPLTHTIAYTLRGLLESSNYIHSEFKEEMRNTVNKASDHLIAAFFDYTEIHGYYSLPGTFDSSWKSGAKYSCLTGNAQIAIIWFKLFQLTGDTKYLESANKIIEQLKTLHLLTSRNPGIRGGIAGSYPIWGKYVNFGYPNWAAKFFADALMLKISLNRKNQ